MSEKIRVIYLDAPNRTITEETIEPVLASYYRMIRCSMIEAVYPEGMKGNLCYVDEEGLYNNHPVGIIINGFNHTVIHGSMVILGMGEEGDDIDCTLSLKLVKQNVTFVDLN